MKLGRDARSVAVRLCVLALIGCASSEADVLEPPPGDDGDDGTPAEDQIALAVEVVASGLDDPVYLTAPGGDARLFVVEQAGRIRIIQDGELLAIPFLDIRDRVSVGGERGLLSVAFHPDYASNGFFYVNYTRATDGATRVERYTVSADRNVADPASAQEILTVQQPAGNHNGGLVMFGPDGMLYVGMGDGGGAGDQFGNGQDTTTLLGALLRIQVNAGDPYAIPPDNPFVDDPDARDEIWAYGLRNPWRFAFDAEEDRLYIADVGQNRWEEIDVAPATRGGINYGWNRTEGRHCFAGPECNLAGLTFPVLEYGHTGGSCSVTGGFVYRGRDIPEVAGRYFYSDFCSGFLRSFRFGAAGVTEQREWSVGTLGNVTSFGQDARRELYILSTNGNVYRLVKAD